MTPGQVGAARDGAEHGVALVVTILMVVLVSALLAGFVGVIVADQRAGGLDGDRTQAYGAAHAGLEKLTSDLAALFAADFSPSATQVNALTAAAPSLPGFQYVAPDGTSGYTIGFTPDASGNPAPADPDGTVISAGPFQGFRGIITPYNITVTARATGGAEVRMRRTLQTVAIPVFQFGMFSETDLAFHAGETFGFGGRVHTNGTLYLAEADGYALTLSDRVTAVQEVIRTQLPNGLSTSSGYNGTVKLLTSPGYYRSLGRLEGSFVPGTGSGTGLNLLWEGISRNTYASYIVNGATGARRLDLPLTSQGAAPIDLIRRPAQGSSENTVNPLVYQQRFFSQASLRILLSDSATEITSLPAVAAGSPVLLGSGKTYAPLGVAATTAPLAVSAGPGANGDLQANVYKSAANEPLLNGYIKIEMQRQNGTWVDVTGEILSLGISGRNLADITVNVNSRWNSVGTCGEPNPNAVIRLQRVRDVPAWTQPLPCGFGSVSGVTTVSPLATDYWPNTLYDTREGQVRDGLGGKTIALGGIIQYVELDVNNLRRWFLGQIGTTGTTAKNDNGYVVYFSDRRNNKNNTLAETGEYGWEDIVNPASNPGTPNGVLDGGEDLNGSTVLDVYGKTARNTPAGPVSPYLSTALVTDIIPNSGATDTLVARANRTLFFRRALKIVNGGLGNLPSPGLTITSENPVYLHGNYNATAASASANPHVAAAIIADAVTLLSNNWNDVRSFVDPSDAKKREATTTGYRVAIIAGKGLAFTKPSYADASFGSDGGAHNFLRNLEDWSDDDVVQRYRGSLVSFYINRQAVGTFKCCQSDVYIRGQRDWAFDTDFLTSALLPPATPMFRDVNTLTFRQLLRPNQ